MTARKRILIVEDDDVLSNVISRNLAARGHQVLVAKTAAEALTKIVEDQPDLILLDIVLPDRPGWDILRQLESYGLAPSVVVMSAVRVSPQRLQEFHPLAYLPKPFPLDALLRVVEGRQANLPEEVAP
jgi:DNA-binding response OmpR family regulator